MPRQDMIQEKLLQQTQLEYQAILENAGVGIILTRARVVQHCNRRASEIFGWPHGALAGQPGSVFYRSAEDYEEMGRIAAPVLAAGEVLERELPMRRRDGSVFPCHLVARAVNAEDPGAGTIWIANDISARKREEEEVRGLWREQQALLDNSLVGIAFMKDRAFVRCNRRFEEIFGYRRGELDGLETRALYLSEEDYQLGGRAYESVARGEFHHREQCMRRKDGTAFWCRVSGRAVAPGEPAQGSVWLAEDITDRRADMERLRGLLAEQQLIFDNATVGIAFQRRRVIQRCNRRLEEIFGYGPGELVGRTTETFFESRADWEAAGASIYAGVSAGASRDALLRYRRKDGSLFWCRVIGKAIDEAGESWIWIFEDVTARKLAEEGLRQAKAELEERVSSRTAELAHACETLRDQYHFIGQLLDAIPSPVFYKDPQGRYLGCNRAFESYVGMDRDTLLGRTAHDIAPRELADVYEAADRSLYESAGTQSYEASVKYADGSLHQVVFYKASFSHADGQLGGLVGVMLDITDRKHMEEDLRLAAAVFESTAEGVVILDRAGRIAAVNKAFTEITGYAPHEVQGRHLDAVEFWPRDSELYLPIRRALLTHGRWQGECVNRRKDGSIFPQWLTVSAVRDAARRRTHYVAVFSDITALKRSQETLDYQARHDPLTDLPNRLLLEDRLASALQRARRARSGVAVLFVDLDRFKNINDSLGHPVGDRVLQQVARRMSQSLRDSDTVARLGGDEFIVVLETPATERDVALVAEKLLGEFRKPIAVDGQDFYITASIGVSLYPRDGADVATLVKNADAAMYRAKERGRNSFEFYTVELTSFAVERFTLETSLRRAVERGELVLHYQPQYRLDSGELVGAEALVRWKHPDKGMVPPGAFIQLAEESGLIVAIGEWVLRTACAQMREWLAQGLAMRAIAVNVSGIEIRRGNILDTVERALRDTGLPARHLELEITEGFIMKQAEQGIEVLDALRRLGVRLSIDDFGTGYSSLSYLKRLPIAKLKIDQGFVRGLPGDGNDAAIAQAIVALARSMQLRVIAEGVETPEQREFLRAAGCDEVQGYLHGRPMDAASFARHAHLTVA